MREMKDSGLKWIGQIPNGWEVNRIKYLFKTAKGLSVTKNNLIEDGLPVISYGQIHSKINTGVTVADELRRFVSYDYRKYVSSKLEKFDFAFADTSEDYEGCGNCVYKRTDDELYGGYHVVILHSIKKEDNRYFAYLFQTDAWREQIRTKASGVKVFSVTQKSINEASVIIPPIEMQARISNFLDAKCAEIDALTADIQTQIDTLEQYKRSVITEAVTKGLNPDVEMKDSGVEWIGKIPVDWEIKPFKYILKERNKKNTPVRTEERLSLSIDKGITLYAEKTTNLDRFKDDVSLYKIAFEGDFVMNSMNMIVGAFDISPYYGCVSPAYYTFYDETCDHIQSRFCNYFFKMKPMMKVLFCLGKGIMAIDRGEDRINTCRLKVSRYDLGKIPVCAPEFNIQKMIVDYLDAKCAEIDFCIGEKKKQLDILNEYKKSLIYEYVTGKKEVPENA